jgi:uncharacterized integral membrane protein
VKSTKTMFLGILLMLLGVSLTSNLASTLFVQSFGFQAYPTPLVVVCALFIVGGLVLGLIGFFLKG